MIDALVALVVDESEWLAASMAASLAALLVLLLRRRRAELPARSRVAGAMNFFFGATIAAMAFGHVLAVSTKLAAGTLTGPVAGYYAIGLALAAPSFALVRHALGMLSRGDDGGRATLVLNGWLALTLLALGLHNFPLAAPAVFNAGYRLHSRRAIGWACVALAIVVNAGLFAGSIVFLASGESFERFKGME